MLVRITILDGSMRGCSYDCDLPEGEEVRLGRDPERCKIVFARDYVNVSRQHCALRSVLGRVRIRTNRQNVVLLGDAPVWDDTLLADGSMLRLGRDGPRISIEVRYPVDAGSLPSTVVMGLPEQAPEVELQQKARRFEGELRTHGRRAWIVRSAIGVVALLGAWLAVEARADAAHLRQAVLDDEQKRVVLDIIARQSQAVPALDQTAAKVAGSVYCVMQRGDNSDIAMPVGTAWVVDRRRGLLATNAHVADEWQPGRLILRQGGNAGDIDVESVEVHPAYTEFGKQLDRYCQAIEVSGADSAARAMRGYDVALLVVPESDRAALAADLRILTFEQAQAIAPGSGCATIGYPAEGVGFNPERPQFKTHLGYVVAVTDYFMAATRPADAQLVHTSLPVAGGASGSPVVDIDGRVIGLISAANVVHSAEGRRIPLAGTTCAQRVDTLRELLDGPVAGQNREAVWAKNFQAAVSNAKKNIEQVLIESFEQVLAAQGINSKVAVMSRDQVEVEWDATANVTIKTVEFSAPASGAYLCCAIADDVVDLDATIFLPKGGRREDRSPDWFPRVAFEVEKGETVRIAAFREGNRPTGATILVLRQVP